MLKRYAYENLGIGIGRVKKSLGVGKGRVAVTIPVKILALPKRGKPHICNFSPLMDIFFSTHKVPKSLKIRFRDKSAQNSSKLI